VARNLDQARTLLATFDRLAEDARSEGSPTAQKYLAGQRLLEQLAQQQQLVLRLMSGLGEQLNALTAVRNECQKRRSELETRSRQVERYLREQDRLIGEIARGSLASALQRQEQVLAQFSEPRPDWPAVGQALSQALEEFSIAQSQAEDDVRNYEQLSGDYERARLLLDRVANLLASRREDRPAANQHLRAAAEALDQVGLDLRTPRGEWTRLLEQVRGASADLERAERLAQEDIRLAAQAEAELAEAIRSVRQAHAYFAMGVTVNTSAA
jgi:chromosome segregation ATPase